MSGRNEDGVDAGYDRIEADRFGDPDVLRCVHVADLPEPGPDEVRLRVEAAGVGYTDTILRRGRYVAYTGGLPLVPGYDVVGIVDAIGADVTGVAIGQRVADMPVHGAYAQYLVRPAASLVPVPTGVGAAAAIEVPLMWTTAWQMLTRTVDLPPGATILVVGAGGSVGRALVSLAVHRGFHVIGTASADRLPTIAAAGATPVDYRRADLADTVRAASGGGVLAAFDAIGGASWETSWRSMRAGGTLVAYGFQDFIESGAPSSDAVAQMARFGAMNAEGRSDGSGRSTTFYDIRERREALPDEYREDALHLLALIAAGTVVPPAAELLPLRDAAVAHRRVAGGGLNHRLVLCP